MLKNSLLILAVLIGLSACTNYPHVPKEYHKLLDNAIANAGDNAKEITKAIESAPAHQKEAVAYLI